MKKKTQSDDTGQIKRNLTKRTRPRRLAAEDFLSTGSTVLNCALSGRWNGGFAKGKYYYIVGDSSSGKTFISMTSLAEASINPAFADYRLIFDDAENGALMDVRHYFPSLAKRLEPPAYDKNGDPKYSTTVEDFIDHLTDAADNGEPFVYVLDSMDSLEATEDLEKYEEDKISRKKGKQTGGDYGVLKAKRNSAYIRRANNALKKHGSILLIVGQTRDRIGFGSQYNPKTRSGGRALTFYAACELWSAPAGDIRAKVLGKERNVGIYCQIKVKKNRVTGVSGKGHEIEIPIIWQNGIDDLGSCVEYLVEEGVWKPEKKAKEEAASDRKKRTSRKVIFAPEFDLREKSEGLILKIQEQGLEEELKKLVGKRWQEIEDASAVDRKNRYV